MPVIVSFDVEAGDDEAQVTKRIEVALVKSIKKILDEIEATQIHAYTSTSNPPLPSGSRYVRTFELRRSSRKKVVKATLPTVQGQWRAIAPYADDVLGSRAQQKPMFAGRWKSIEDVQNIVQPKAENIVRKQLENLK